MPSEKVAFLLIALLLGLVGAAYFAHCALRILTTKGNRIKDVLDNPNLKDAEAIKIEILDKIKLSSNYPAVALFILAAAVGTGPFGAAIYYIMSIPKETINVVGNIGNYAQLFQRAGGEHVCIEFSEMVVTPDGRFSIPLRAVENPQLVVFESQRVLPLTLVLQYKHPQKKILVDGLSAQQHSLSIDGGTAVFPVPVVLNRAQP